MSLLFHISDLHFGPKFNAHLSERVLEDIVRAQPDLTIISGDFTMTARETEYAQAREYLARLPKPVVTIPGNHDQPLAFSAAWERVSRPWARYTRYISPMIDVRFEMPGIFVVGVNDNHPIVPGGIWSFSQRKWIAQEFASAPQDACKIFVMHHQLNWDGKWRPFGQWFPNAHLAWLKRLGVELALNGHTHVPLSIQSAHGIVIAQAGTSMSSRVRHGHGNAYNQITITPESLTVQVMGYDDQSDRFVLRSEKTFPRKTLPEKRP